MLGKEKAGERVFADVDRALAGRVISRSIENSKETEPVTDGSHIDTEIDGAVRTNGIDDFPLLPEGAVPFIKITALLLALVMLILLFLSNNKDRRQ